MLRKYYENTTQFRRHLHVPTLWRVYSFPMDSIHTVSLEHPRRRQAYDNEKNLPSYCELWPVGRARLWVRHGARTAGSVSHERRVRAPHPDRECQMVDAAHHG